MTRLWVVVRREYLERVRSKAFVIGTLLGPLLLLLLSLGPTLLMARQRGRPLRVAVVDESGRLGPALEATLRARHDDGRPRFDVREAPGAGRLEALRREILAGTLDGYVYVPLDGPERFALEYRGKNLSNLTDLALLENLLEHELRRQRLRSVGLAPELLNELTRQPDFKRIQLSESGEREDHGASFLLAFTLVMALYSAVAMWGAALMNGVIEEKANRVVEVVVSSIPTSTLFAGKLLGVGAVGLTQLLAWSVFALSLSLLGAGSARGLLSLPEIPAGLLLALLLAFLLGFFLYGALYMAVGAAVNSQQEAQSLAFPVMLPLVLGVMFFPTVLNSPDSPLAVALSLVPCWAPLLMFLRLSATSPPAWQVLLALGLTLGTIVLATLAAARIYRVGILMYGKRPSVSELWRWSLHR